MERLRTEYERGDKTALTLAILGCGVTRRPMPSWIVEAWKGGWIKVAMRVADWNNLLGDVKLKTPKQLERERNKSKQFAKLAELVPSARSPIARDIEEGAFSELAKKMGTTPRAVKELYYKKVKIDGKDIRLLPPSVLRRRAIR